MSACVKCLAPLMAAVCCVASPVANAAEPVRTAVLCGGSGDMILKRVCACAAKPQPKVVIFGTASADRQEKLDGLTKRFTAAGAAEVECVKMWTEKPEPVAVRAKILSADVIWLCSGYTERLMAKINFYHLADTFREAYRRGTVFAGYSAGGLAIAHAGYNDFTDKRDDLIEGLGLLNVFFGPHFQYPRWSAFEKRLEAETSPVTPSVAWALEDGAMVVFRNEKPADVFSEKPHVYRFDRKDGVWTKTTVR